MKRLLSEGEAEAVERIDRAAARGFALKAACTRFSARLRSPRHRKIKLYRIGADS